MMVWLAGHERLQMFCVIAMVVWMNGGQMSSLASSLSSSMASRSPTLSSLASESPTLSSRASANPTLSPSLASSLSPRSSVASSSSSPTSSVPSLTPTLSPSRVALSPSTKTLTTKLSSSIQTFSASSASSSSSSSGKRRRSYEEKEENAQAAIPADLQRLEAGFTKWVQYIGSLRHSVFGVAQNQGLPRSTLLVDKRPGAGHFSSIQAAIDSVPEMNVRRVRIFIAPGTYTEKVFIPYTKPFITIQGTNSTSTIIQWGDTADKKGAGGNPLGTFNSATVAVEAPYFIAKNITFKNTAPRPSPGSKDQQAVALRISGDAAVFEGCQFLGAQDTLYDHKGRHFFQDCYVEGSVDFIFGDGLSMYKGCHLHAIGAPYEALTAQNRNNPQDDSGFSFVNCKVTGSGPLYLGRAWGTFSRVVYSYTFMDSIIVPKGWYDWGDPKRELTVYYGQYKCFGPGANNTGRVTWSKELTTQEAHPFLDLSFIDGTEWVLD